MFTIIGGDGREYGPVTALKITEWINGGRANGQTRAKRVDETEWKTLAEFPEFAAQLGGSTTTPPIVSPIAPPVFPSRQPSAAATTAPDVVLASRWLRLGAQLIDGVFQMVCVMPAVVAFVFAMAANKGDLSNITSWGGIITGGVLLLFAIIVIAGVQIWQLTTRGQTVGKRLLGIRIVKIEDGSLPGFVVAFVMRALIPGVLGAIPWVGGLFSLVDILFIFREDKRCIHDLIAGTIVVQGNPPEAPAPEGFRA